MTEDNLEKKYELIRKALTSLRADDPLYALEDIMAYIEELQQQPALVDCIMPPDPWERRQVIYQDDAEIGELMKQGWVVCGGFDARPGDTVSLRRPKPFTLK